MNITALKRKQCEILQFKYILENLVLNTVQKLNNCSNQRRNGLWPWAPLQYQYITEIGDDCNCTNTAIVLGLTSTEPASRLVILCIRTHWAPIWRVVHFDLGIQQKYRNSNNINKRWTTIDNTTKKKDEIPRQRNKDEEVLPKPE